MTTILAIGSEFPDVGGYRFRVEQPTRGETFLWRSDAKPSEASVDIREEIGEEANGEILVVMSVTGDASEDAIRHFSSNHRRFAARVFAQPRVGPGDASLQSDADACALAIHTKDLIRSARSKYKARRTHLVLYAPASYCLFLGQRLNAVGDIITNERTAEGEYQESLTLKTG